MKMDEYRSILTSPVISFNDMCKKVDIGMPLFKYRSFYNKNKGTYKENKFWKENMRGKFHLSLACEFEDRNDCKPYIRKEKVCNSISDFLENMKIPNDRILKITKKIQKVITKDYLDVIIHNYQRMIRIGCFTTEVTNFDMWNKYADEGKGFCIEYNTSKSQLFQNSVLPVLYSDEYYDSSLTLVNQLILESVCKGKNRSIEKNVEIYSPIYEKILKTAYVPLFIKGKKTWEFEHEYRMFILKHRTSESGKINVDEVLDADYNIDLSDAIKAIYLGEKFDEIPDSKRMFEEVHKIASEMNVKLYQKKYFNGKHIDKLVI